MTDLALSQSAEATDANAPWPSEIAPSGRKKRGGRKPGSRNIRTRERAKLLEAIRANGSDPMAFFFSILKNENAPIDARFDAARELMPYVHPRLASIEARSGGRTHQERLAELQSMLQGPSSSVGQWSDE